MTHADALAKVARDLSDFYNMTEADAAETLARALEADINGAYLMGKALGVGGIHLAVRYRRISAQHREYHRRQKRRNRR